MEPVCEAAGEIDKKIVELVGSMEFFLSTVFRAGRDLNRLITATPSIWHRLFMEALNLDCYEPLRKLADENATNAALRQNEATIRIEELQREVSDERKVLESIDQDGLVVRIAGLTKRLADSESEKASLERQRTAMLERRGLMRERINRRSELETRIREAKRALEGIVLEDIGPAPELLPEDETADPKRRANLEATITMITDKIGALETEMADLRAKIAGGKRSVESLNTAIAQTEKRLSEWQAAKDKLPDAPCEWSLKPGCWFYQQAARPETGKRFIEELQSYKLKIEEHEQEISRGELRIRELTETATDERHRLEVNQEMLKQVVESIAVRERRTAEITARDLKVAAQAQLFEQRTARENELGTLDAQLALVPDQTADLSDLIKEIERTDNRISAQAGIIGAAQGALREAEREAARVEEIGQRILKLTGSISEHSTALDKHSADQRAWLLVAQAFHHTGIPYLLMERVIGSFQETANELLDGTGMSIQVETVTPTRKGEARDKLTVRFTDGRGQHLISQASGEQGTLLSIVLSSALSITGSAFWGAAPALYIQDEGWGTLDEAHLELARELIARIAARFMRFIYITHTEALADSADVRLRVVSNNGQSELVQ
jgi:exonuclease SbcC